VLSDQLGDVPAGLPEPALATADILGVVYLGVFQVRAAYLLPSRGLLTIAAATITTWRDSRVPVVEEQAGSRGATLLFAAMPGIPALLLVCMLG
jgi:hypothetical protein